jgi:hypothetical protein
MYYEIIYQGKAPSLNLWYASNGWWARNKAKQEFKVIFEDLLSKADIKYMEAFRIEMIYNSRFDPDNAISLIKMLVDSLKGTYVKDDTKQFFKGLSIEPNLELKSSTYIIRIHPLDGDKERNKRPNRVKSNQG